MWESVFPQPASVCMWWWFFSCSVMSDSLWPRGLQNARLPCPSLSPRHCSNSCPLSRWCYLTISSSAVLFSFCLQSFPISGSFPISQFFPSGGQSIGTSALASVFPSIRVFSNGLALRIRWPKYWSFSFSISPSNKYSGLISFKIDWFDLLAIWGTLKNLLQHHNLRASILWRSAFFLFN